MKRLFAILIFLGATLCPALNPSCEARDGQGWQKFLDGYYRFDGKIRKFLMGGMDSTYVSLPSTSFEIPLVSYVYGFDTRISPSGVFDADGKPASLNFNSHAVADMGIGFGYHGLDLVYTWTLNSENQYFEFNYYDNYWGLGINTGNEFMDVTGDGESDIYTHETFLHGYVALCGNRYSYPASFYGNYIQTRSAGSPLINFWYNFRTFKCKDDWSGRNMFDPNDEGFSRMNTGALTAGYGYNFAFAQGRFVLNMSAGVGIEIPSVGLATTGTFGGIFWINEHLRFNFAICNYYQKSRYGKLDVQDHLWRAGFSLNYCFGK